MSYTAMSKAIVRYKADGMQSLAPRRRERRLGDDRSLSAEQEQAVRRIMTSVRDRSYAPKSQPPVLNNLSVRHCKPVKAWPTQHVERMDVFYLPSYGPELNPEERLNADLKHVIGRKVPIRVKAKLRAAAEDRMQAVASEPERARAYFQDPCVKYAA